MPKIDSFKSKDVDDAKCHMLHSIFLTREQRYAIFELRDNVVVNGFCYSVWHKNSLSWESPEVICEYIITTNREKRGNVQIVDNGYIINIPNLLDQRGLADFIDGGSKSCYFVENGSVMLMDNKCHVITHTVNIEDMAIFEGSFLRNLDQN